MNIPDGLLGTYWLVLGYLVYIPAMLLALKLADWKHIKINADFNVFLGMTVAVLFVWNMKAGFAEGLNLHLVGATLLTLMFGWAFAMISLSLVLLGITLLGEAGWSSFAVNAVLMIVFPVAISGSIYHLVDKKLPNHFFIYIFVNAFFGAAIALGVTGLVSTWVLNMSDAYSYEYLVYNYLAYYPLLLFPEAFITGMLMTVFVLYFPAWVSTFDDARYLKNH